MPKQLKLFREIRKDQTYGEIYNGDAINFLRSIDSESVPLIFLDPPFNLGKKYSEKNKDLDNMSEEDYIIWIQSILNESVRVLSKGGALYIYHLPSWCMRFGHYLGQNLDFRHWIAISMKNNFVRSNRLYPAHYGLLYFTKGDPISFNRPKLTPQTCRKCGTTIKDYGGYKSIIEEKGINLSDFWDDISPVRHNSKKLRKQNQLPLLLTDRIMEISGVSGGLFVDPFVGTGTSVVSAINHKMKFKCCDLVIENCIITSKRLEQLQNLTI